MIIYASNYLVAKKIATIYISVTNFVIFKSFDPENLDKSNCIRNLVKGRRVENILL